ncbi:MAG: hypothetical protein KGJ13_01305 [Patescibacteria group bacterium]|nr:hypothetical protein [Patescibacteria group bacterium]
MAPGAYMPIPKLKRAGTCSICKQRIPVKPQSFVSALEDHSFRGKNCSGPKYTATDIVFIIESPKEAVEVANFIKEDDGESCFGIFGFSGHTLACRDGKNCNALRHSFARALAEYYLRTLEQGKNAAKPA